MQIKKLALCLAFLGSIPALGQTVERPLWLRYPALSPDGKQIAFTYKGDIYRVSSSGGEAVRLTTHAAYDSHPIWSPDGKQIAFTSTRNGFGSEIYVMPSMGGSARRVTTHSTSEIPYTFTPDGAYIVFKAHIQDPASSALFPTPSLTELYQIPVSGGEVQQLLPTAAEQVRFSADGNKILFQDLKGFENEWRKHHTSSVTRDIVEYDLKSKTYRYVVKHDGEDRDPIYSPDGKEVYFLSERRGGSMNVYKTSILAEEDKVVSLTSFKGEPVRFLTSSREGLLCFSQAGELHTLIPGEKPKRLTITLTHDLDDTERVKLPIMGGMQSTSLSPDGKQIAFVSRGEVFVTSAEYSTTKRITNSPAAERAVSFGGDNRTIVYDSYRDGHWDLYEAKIARSEDPNFPNATSIIERKLLPKLRGEKALPQFSPDGKEIAFVLERRRLVVYNIASKSLREITDGSTQQDMRGDIDYSWSPDGKWFVLSYVARAHAPYSDIGIVSAAGGQEIMNLTNSGYFSSNPRWSADGNSILFSTDRYGMRNHASWGSQNDVMIAFLNRKAYEEYRMSQEEYEIYQEQTKKAEAEAKAKEQKEAKKKSSKKDDKKASPEAKSKDIVIEWEGIEDRIVRLTPNSSSLGDAILTADGKKLYYLAAFEGSFDLWSKDMRKGNVQLVRKGAGGSWFQTNKDGKTIFLFGSGGAQKLDPASGSLKPVPHTGEVRIDKGLEREAMFAEVEREQSLRFYRADMHGVDWPKLTKTYRRYLPHINNGYDFAEMLSELLGELNVSHTGSGYRGDRAQEATAELGLFYHRLSGKDGLVVDEVVASGPFDKSYIKIEAGDVIESIDGEEIKAGKDFFEMLNGKAGKSILVSLRSHQTGKSTSYTIKPISSGALNALLYKRWVRQRADEVERLSGGQLGYVHIPSMGDPSFRTVYADVLGRYYGRKGIVIDIRYNGGGRLHEDIEVFFSGKKYLQQEIRGKDYCEMPSRRWNHASIMLTCEADYSNAHGTPWVYQKMKIGKVVGMPVPGTMTSVNWVTLQDPSLYFGIPAVGYRTAEGGYLENLQLEPDVKVSLDFEKALSGKDSQLERAVEELLKDVK